ncbi:MAG: pyruvate dehydrogenase (acetyl-transferring) E1 component subunit alpha [Halodesulfurarchaeum sp.]
MTGQTVSGEFGERILDDEGAVHAGAEIPDLSDEQLVEMYHWMRFGRRFDEKGVSLQRQGRMGTFSTLTGHEAALVGSEFAMDDGDWIAPYYRDHLATIAHGVPPENIYQYYMGHEDGNKIPEDVPVLPISIVVGSHLLHGVGVAWGSTLTDSDDAVVTTYFGDGATSEGDFHEALNFAGVFDTPNLFFCLNNQWAISTPSNRQTASETFAQKANAYGFDGIRVDGTDPLAVYSVTKRAAEQARTPDGDEPRPSLIEAVLYRVAAHNTADDPSNYRSDEAKERWEKRDPVGRFETFLQETGRIDDDRIEEIESDVEATVEAAVDAAEATVADPNEMFEYAYETPPIDVQRQNDYLQTLRSEYGDDALLED